MCVCTATTQSIREIFRRQMDAMWDEGQTFTPDNNIRPVKAIPAVRLTENGRLAGNHIWGYLPEYAESRKFIWEWKTFNARADRIATSKLYSKPFRESRSLVVVSAFFEWPKLPGEKKPSGPPRTITPVQQEMFVFGGVWGSWRDPETKVVHDTTTMITTDPNAKMKAIPHHRMPAILPPTAWGEWLNPDTPVGVLQDMLHPTPDEWLEIITGGPLSFVAKK